MNKVKLFGFPELLLLLILPVGVFFRGHDTLDVQFHDTYFVIARDWLLLRLNIAISISWMFHVALRSKYPASFPSRASWTHVILSLFGLGVFYYALATAHLKFISLANGPGMWMANSYWSFIGWAMVLLLMGVQILFWILATRSSWKRERRAGVARR